MTRLLTALCLVVAGSLHAQVPTGQTSIAGRIVADATDEPVRRAHVIAFGTTTRTMSITSTDADGRFQFPSLPEDRYRIGVSRPPYVSAMADASTSPALFRLARAAAISGQVVNALGRPKGGVAIIARTAAGVESGRTTTDAQGRYRISGLASGDHRVSAEGVALDAPITLTTGEHRPHVDFTLPPATDEPPAQAGSGTGRIAGRVRSTADGSPLMGVTVLLTGRAAATSETTSTGTFEFTQLPAGTYTLRLGEGAFAPHESAVVDVGDQPITNLLLRGLGLGSIGGVVRDDRGDPMGGVPVTAYLRSPVTEVPFLIPRSGFETDENGAYWISGLLPGDYLVCACGGRTPRLDPAMLRRLIGQSPQPAQLLPFMAGTAAFTPGMFYPGRARAADALAVSIAEMDDRLGIDITIPISATHTVFGQLMAPAQGRLEGTTVRLVQAGELAEALAFTEMTPRRLAPDGRFSIPGVPPGSYTLLAYPGKGLGPTGVSAVTVEDRDVSGVMVPLSAGGSVRGRVAFAPGATPPSGAQVEKGQVYLSSTEGNLLLARMASPSGSFSLQAPVAADGSFALSGIPPGPYRITAGGFVLPWFSIESVTTSHGMATDHVFTVEPDAQTDVVITMSPIPPATLEGSTRLEEGEGPRTLNIVLVATDWRTRRSFFRTGAGFYAQFVSADGSFRFPSVPAGDYFLVAASPSDFQLTEARLAQWERLATRVTLRAGETTTTTLKR